MKDKVTAGVLALLLGGLGVHKFYLTRIVQGIIYLLLCWTFIPAIIAFIEGIIYLTMDESKFNNKYNPNSKQFLSTTNLNQLEQLHRMKESGVITESEFQIKKENLL